jgi:hypothetical protein
MAVMVTEQEARKEYEYHKKTVELVLPFNVFWRKYSLLTSLQSRPGYTEGKHMPEVDRKVLVLCNELGY